MGALPLVGWVLYVSLRFGACSPRPVPHAPRRDIPGSTRHSCPGFRAAGGHSRESPRSTCDNTRCAATAPTGSLVPAETTEWSSGAPWWPSCATAHAPHQGVLSPWGEERSEGRCLQSPPQTCPPTTHTPQSYLQESGHNEQPEGNGEDGPPGQLDWHRSSETDQPLPRLGRPRDGKQRAPCTDLVTDPPRDQDPTHEQPRPELGP